jgi:hypothetical protein
MILMTNTSYQMRVSKKDNQIIMPYERKQEDWSTTPFGWLLLYAQKLKSTNSMLSQRVKQLEFETVEQATRHHMLTPVLE